MGPVASTTSVRPPVGAGSLSAPKKLLLLMGNALPLLHAAGVVILLWLLWRRPWPCAAAVAGWLYLLPPVLCRTLLLAMPIRSQFIPMGTSDFFVWWFSLNLQMLFIRFPSLEEFLRLMPGVYSAWLRLWGARVGKLTYWGAGLQILDRPFIHVGDHVIFGAGVRINPHVMQHDPAGRPMLVLAPVTISDRVSVGGYSLLVAGAHVGPDQATRAFLVLPPFNRLESGRRVKPDDAGTATGMRPHAADL